MEYQGTKGEFKEDIGIDLLGVNDELMQVTICSKQVNTHSVAHVFGLSQEEVMANAKLFANSKEMFEMLKVLISYYENGELCGLALRSDIDKANELLTKITEKC